MSTGEAEIQLLATLRKSELEELPADRGSLERLGGRYWMFLEDWSGAYGSLLAKGLIDGDDDGDRRSLGPHRGQALETRVSSG